MCERRRAQTHPHVRGVLVASKIIRKSFNRYEPAASRGPLIGASLRREGTVPLNSACLLTCSYPPMMVSVP